MSLSKFTWIEFYEELAAKLLQYKENRPALISTIHIVYEKAGLPMPTLETNNNVTDIDPFTVFGLFNKGLSDANRAKIAETFKNELSINTSAPKDFSGIPVVNNMSATFYYFQDERDEHDIDNLWNLFEAAIKLADSDTKENREAFITSYNAVCRRKGIRWNITMGLYWIRPNAFISFDSTNRNFIRAHQNTLPDSVTTLNENKTPDGNEYLTIRDALLDLFANGTTVYKSIPEFSKAAWEWMQNPLSPHASTPKGEIHYWIYSPGHGAEKWNEFYNAGIMGLGWDELGDLSGFKSKAEITQKMNSVYGENKRYPNNTLATWQFSHEVKPGDIIFVKRGRLGEILGRGVVKSNYSYDNTRQEYKHTLSVDWLNNGEWNLQEVLPMKALTNITQYVDLVEKLQTLFYDGEDGPENPSPQYESYTEDDFLNEVYIAQPQYQSLVALLKRKKNIILQGAPGVGKTFIAKRLAYSLMGTEDKERVMLVQFHQSYSYEDFIMGFRPTKDGFEIKTGAFYNFCKKAADDSDNDYYFIIDEINRGNLNKIFGELFMLLEADKRNEEVQLLYKNERFSVPENLYLIGTMNTADRSIAMLDYALRRRFSFFDIKPGFETDGFKKYQATLGNTNFDKLINVVKDLNNTIIDDETLGEGFAIGHSYFCGLKPEEVNDNEMSAIVEYEILPLLKEYWFDEPSNVKTWSEKLRSALR